MTIFRAAAVAVVLSSVASASPAATPHPLPDFRPHPVADAPAPHITPFRVIYEPTKTLHARANIVSKIESGVNSVLSAIGSGIPSWVASGVPLFFQNFPEGTAVQSSLGIDSSALAALPTQVLNLPPYGNWMDQGWNVRFHGNVYKQPKPDEKKLNQLANFFVPGDLNQLPQDQQARARNMTAQIFVVQQANVTVKVHLEPAPGAQPQGGGGGITPTGGAQDLTLPYNTTGEGDYDVFMPINSAGLAKGNETVLVQKLNVYAVGADLGNATAYLVPTTGYTVVSDIDDILRVTKIYKPKEGLLNSFARPFVPWENMPQIYANWARQNPNLHFHYLTTTPEQVTRTYMDFIFNTYPLGSFDTRPLNFSNIEATLKIRKFLLDKIFQTFPQRKFILVADTSNSDVMRDYPTMAKQYPDQVQCIFLRNTSATDDNKFPYNTKEFKGLNQSRYMFFIRPDDLQGVDIAGGNCYNSSIKQNVTYGLQDELLGIHGAASTLHTGSWSALFTVFIASIFLLL